MNHYVADTHTLFWYLTASPRLGTKAKLAFDEGVRGEALIYIPVIVLAELYYLNEKLGNVLDFSAEFQRLQNSGQFTFISFHPQDVLDFDTDSKVPEMHDRIIVGVARRLKAICLTRDVAIMESRLVTTLWD
jgi:PIN domain nuclease of toxin-antitoxin system